MQHLQGLIESIPLDDAAVRVLGMPIKPTLYYSVLVYVCSGVLSVGAAAIAKAATESV